MLLNFLIAIVSEAYEGVIARKDFYRYRHRCDINKEYLIYYEFFSKYVPCMSRMKSFNCLIVQSEYHGDDLDQWIGMVQKIQNSIEDQGSDVKDHTVSQSKKLEHIILVNRDRIQNEVRENKQQIYEAEASILQNQR
jgi:hypothetical protein